MATVASGRLTVGKTYLFKNKADGSRALNVWCSSSYPATSLSNVCLWTADTSDNAQLWKLVDYNGHYVLQSVENTSMYLDLYTGSGNGANRNAHLYSVSSTSYLTFEAGAYSNTVRIRLAGSTNNGHYLTANQGSNGSRTGKTTGAAGNVYFWSALLSDNSQEWIFNEVGGSSSVGSDNPYADLNWQYVFSDTSNTYGCYGYDPAGTEAPYHKSHFGIDVFCNEGIPIYAPANATVYAVGAEIGKRQTPDTPNVDIDDAKGTGSMGFFITLKMDDLDPVSGKSMYVRCMHMKQLPTYRYNDRVAKGDLIGYVGNTGSSDTAHLHLDVNTMSSSQWTGTNMTRSNTINPVNFFPDATFRSHYYNIDYYG